MAGIPCAAATLLNMLGAQCCCEVAAPSMRTGSVCGCSSAAGTDVHHTWQCALYIWLAGRQHTAGGPACCSMNLCACMMRMYHLIYHIIWILRHGEQFAPRGEQGEALRTRRSGMPPVELTFPNDTGRSGTGWGCNEPARGDLRAVRRHRWSQELALDGWRWGSELRGL